MLLPHDTHVLVIDGSRMQVLRNRGTTSAPDFEVLHARTQHNPPNRTLAAGAPGRRFESMGTRRGAYEVTDLHQQREDDLGSEGLDFLSDHAGSSAPLILVAPPRMLGFLRTRMPKDLHARVIAEIDKDLTKFQPSEICAHLVDHA
jgi:protein required for attachment to host cells